METRWQSLRSLREAGMTGAYSTSQNNRTGQPARRT